MSDKDIEKATAKIKCVSDDMKKDDTVEISDHEKNTKGTAGPEKKKSVKRILLISFIAVIVAGVACFFLFPVTAAEKESINAANEAITDIGEVNEDSGERIRKAEDIYSTLGVRCRLRVDGNTLTKAREEFNESVADYIDENLNKIDSDNITVDNYSMLSMLKEYENEITGDIGKYKSVFDKLDQMYEKSENLAVSNVEELILKIGEVTLNSEKDIKTAKEAYKNLNSESRAKVSNYDVLNKACDSYDAAVAKEVDSKIEGIGEISLDSGVKKRIDAARSAYNNLSESQRNKVGKYDELRDAEKSYSDLSAENSREQRAEEAEREKREEEERLKQEELREVENSIRINECTAKKSPGFNNVSIVFNFTNMSDKKIIMVVATFTPCNADGEELYSPTEDVRPITIAFEESFAPGETYEMVPDDEWYNKDIEKIRVDYVQIWYEDNTLLEIDTEEKLDIIRPN